MALTDQSLHSSSIEQTFQLQVQLNKLLEHPIAIRLNSNSSSFVSVRFGETRKPVSASIHKFFLKAPESVMNALADFISEGGRDRSSADVLKKFIQDMSDQNQDPIPLNCVMKGKAHDLQLYFDRLNQLFFNGSHPSSITWFKSRKGARAKRRCFLGIYIDELFLIKINSLLDDEIVPDYVVESVVYHEMLHAIYPPKVYPSGRRIIHTPEFKEAETKYPKLLDAENWLNNNRSRFFRNLIQV